MRKTLSGPAILAGAALALAAMQGPSVAQATPQPVYGTTERAYRGDDRDRYMALSGLDPARAGCIQACANDRNPCDPVWFKRSDGRCTGD